MTVGQEITLAACIVGVVLLTALAITVSFWSKQIGGDDDDFDIREGDDK